MAKTAFIERKIGMVSSRTLSEKRGYVWPQELIRQLEEMLYGIYPPVSGNMSDANSSSAEGGLDVGSNADSQDGTKLK